MNKEGSSSPMCVAMVDLELLVVFCPIGKGVCSLYVRSIFVKVGQFSLVSVRTSIPDLERYSGGMSVWPKSTHLKAPNKETHRQLISHLANDEQASKLPPAIVLH
jgi:hypothetical protein